jgi:hypothetical protein
MKEKSMGRLLSSVVVCFVVLGCSILFSQSLFPQEASGWVAATDALVGAFDRADVIVLGEGHGRKADSDFRVALVRNPKFAEAVQVIVLEAPQPELSAAVEEVNQGFPTSRGIQTFLNQTPPGGDRNATAVAIVRKQALDKGQKALVVFGSGHVWRRFGGVTKLLEQVVPGRVLVVETIAPVDPRRATPESVTQFAASSRALEATLRSRNWPVLFALPGSAAASLEADPFYLGQAMFGAQVTLGDLADAVVYFGTSH